MKHVYLISAILMSVSLCIAGEKAKAKNDFEVVSSPNKMTLEIGGKSAVQLFEAIAGKSWENVVANTTDYTTAKLGNAECTIYGSHGRPLATFTICKLTLN